MKNIILVFSVLGLTGCGLKKQDFTAQVSSEDAAVETAVGAISGLSDNQAGESYLAINNSFKEKMFIEMQNFFLPQAVASDGCQRPIFEACINGIREAIYNNCSPANSKASVNGYIRLTYSQNNCSMANVSDKVNRTYEVTISGPRGGSATLSSANKSDYNGDVYGGGGQLTKTASGFDVDVLGKNISLDYKGIELYNVSIRTLATVHVTGTLSRQNRLVDGGQIQVNHNKAKFTALFEPHNLQWQSGCCYPVSGSLSVTYSGSKTGSATVTFNGCGLAKHSDGIQEKPVVLNYCE